MNQVEHMNRIDLYQEHDFKKVLDFQRHAFSKGFIHFEIKTEVVGSFGQIVYSVCAIKQLGVL